ncbi:MAG: 50S ribosomal protein L11 methyltransferase [Gammaproteobacteria bacterium]
MAWLQIEFELGDVDPAAAENHLLELGAAAISYRDSGDDPILEPAPGTTPLWNNPTVLALLAATVDRQQIIDRLVTLSPAIKPENLKFVELPEKNWQAEWRQRSEPMCFGERLWLYPWKVEHPDDGRVIVELEPGLAFGTGEHPSTAMCLRWLDSHSVTDKQVLDYGCGSGVLAIAAAALGARRCTAIDIDPQALLATQQNARQNKRQNLIRVMEPAKLPLQPEYDVILANILSGTLLELATELQQLAAPGAELVLSGILEQQAEQIIAGYGWLELQLSDQKDEWVLLEGRL